MPLFSFRFDEHDCRTLHWYDTFPRPFICEQHGDDWYSCQVGCQVMFKGNPETILEITMAPLNHDCGCLIVKSIRHWFEKEEATQKVIVIPPPRRRSFRR